MPTWLTRIVLLLALGALAMGCKPEIGDDCQLSTDCSAAGDRLCDITAPGGYCTIYNCEPGTCPEEESLCVQFASQRSTVEGCFDAQSPSPYSRAFCMATCESNDDCRSGYECASLKGTNAWGALLIDTDRGDRACLVPQSAEPLPDDRSGEVCRADSSPAPSGTAGGAPAGLGGSLGAGGADGVGGQPSEGGAPAEGGAAGAAEAGQSGAAG